MLPLPVTDVLFEDDSYARDCQQVFGLDAEPMMYALGTEKQRADVDRPTEPAEPLIPTVSRQSQRITAMFRAYARG